MANTDQINGLVDIALQLKQQIENRDIDKIRVLFNPNAKVNIYGRFYNLKQMLSNLPKLFSEIEQPGLDITSVDETEIEQARAFISFSIEIFWIDQKTWEESSQLATLSLELERDTEKKEAERKENWLITGFTLSRNKKIIEKEEVPLFVNDPASNKGSKDSGSFLDGLFNFWY